MPKQAERSAVPQIAKAVAKGHTLTPAQPSGAYDRLSVKDGATIAWLMPRGSYLRVMYVADVTGAPKQMLKDTVLTKGRIYVRVTEENVEQARDLIAWAIEKAPPAKTPPKPKAATAKPKPRTASRKPARSSRSRPKQTEVLKKRRIRFRTPMGDLRTEDIAADEADAFVASLVAEGHEILSGGSKA